MVLAGIASVHRKDRMNKAFLRCTKPSQQKKVRSKSQLFSCGQQAAKQGLDRAEHLHLLEVHIEGPAPLGILNLVGLTDEAGSSLMNSM